MSLYSRAKKGLGILALAWASYIGNPSLEARVYAAEPEDNIVAAVPQPFAGRTPKNEKEAVEQMYSYSFDHDNWAKVVDLGRDNANGYFASLANDKSSSRVNAAFTLLKKEYLDKAKAYNQVFGREIDQPFITWTESMLKKVKDNQLKAYLLINVVDTTQSLEEFTRRINDLETRDHELASQYRNAEKKLNLRLLPGGVEYWFGATDGKAGIDKLVAEVALHKMSLHSINRLKQEYVYSQIPGSGWKIREESVLVGAFELIDSEKSVLPIMGGLYSLKDKAKDIANKQGFTGKDLVSIIKEEEWEQGARGSKTKRYSIYGSLDHIKTLAELNSVKDLMTDFFYLEDGGRKYLSEAELIRKTPLDKSPYGLIGMVGNFGEVTEGEAKRAMNATPSDEERTAYAIVPRSDGAIEKGAILIWHHDYPLVWEVRISNRHILNPFKELHGSYSY